VPATSQFGHQLDHLGERASSLRPGDFVGLDCAELCAAVGVPYFVVSRRQPLPAAAGACWTPDLLPDNAQAVLKAFPKADCGGYPLFHKAPSLIGQLNLWKEVAGWSAPMASNLPSSSKMWTLQWSNHQPQGLHSPSFSILTAPGKSEVSC
jgi:hypothetical protein